MEQAPSSSCTKKHSCCLAALPLLAAVILALGIFYGTMNVKNGLQTFRQGDRVVSVKGLSERDVIADMGVWSLTYTRTGNDLKLAQEGMDSDARKIEAFLTKAGFEPASMERQPLQSQDLLAQAYRPEGANMGRYILTQTLMVRSDEINKIERVVGGVGDLLRDGVTLINTEAPRYIFRGLNTIKPEMLAEAISNARTGAAEFAKASGQEVGLIKQASQGVFQILPRDEGLPIPESAQKNKRVRVVSTVDFYLK